MSRVLIACEESQTVCKAFRELGHEAYSCDIQECSGGYLEWHFKGDMFDVFEKHGPWDLVIAHPPCTYLTVSANKWLKDQPPRKSGALVGEARREARREAIEFFMRIWNLPIEKLSIENPIGCMSSEFRKPNQVLQPWMFGHGETKATCLWSRGIPDLIPTDIVVG